MCFGKLMLCILVLVLFAQNLAMQVWLKLTMLWGADSCRKLILELSHQRAAPDRQWRFLSSLSDILLKIIHGRL